MDGIYRVNLIPGDLSSEETILQIADTLENLNGIVDDVFTRVLGTITNNMNKTSKLKERIETSRKKVEKLTGMQKAIKVFSSAKYPPSITHEHYQSVFDFDVFQHQPKKITLSQKTQGPGRDKEIHEKLHFFHVKVGLPRNAKAKPDFDINEALKRISSVDQLLVFNTDESPYFVKSSKVPAYVPKIQDAPEKSLLEAAPSSILKRDVLKREADEYLYAPGIGLVPELEMPVDLPDLPGVAGDVQFLITSEGSIAPSAVTTPMSPVLEAELPDIALPDVKVLPDLKELPLVPDVSSSRMPDVPDATPVHAAVPAPVITPQVAMPPPPPPPPPPPTQPPPPPPPPMETEITTTIKREEKQTKPPPSSGGDAHANLMAAIRQAGGAGRAKLKPAADVADDKGAKNARVPSGDLMADLHAKLSMRRRGISGVERGGSVLHTLASVIPEPDEPSSAHSSSNDDDDWK